MRKINLLACLAIVLLGTTLMNAQATRTWVSGVGDDANPCSRTAPCKTFAGAISKTAPGGEIDALDPGGFGALTITKAITLDGGGGQVASVLVSGTNGIVVAAQPTDRVIIRNMRLDGLLGGNSTAGLSGIRFISGKDLNIENCVIFGFNNAGIDIELGASGTSHIVNTIIKNIGTCAPGSCTTAQGDGIFASTTSGTVVVTIDNSQIMLTSNNGVEASTNARLELNRSIIASAGASGAISDGAASSSRLGFNYGEITNSANGVTATNGSTLVVGHASIAYNTNNGYNPSGGSVFAWSTGATTSTNGTNRVHDNGATGTPTGYITEN
jgi:hypothetical protein